MISIAIVDDNDFLRKAMMERLGSQFRLITDASQAKYMLRFLKTQAPANHPQVVLMDIAMDEMDGITATALVKEANPAIKVIMLTVFEDVDKVLQAIKMGADGYCLKDEPADKLIGCIEDVVAGGSYMSPSVARKAMRYLQQTYVPAEPAANNPLTSREQEILQYVIEGRTYQSIADMLFVSLATVKSHVYNIYEKLQVNNKMEAMRIVKEKRWI